MLKKNKKIESVPCPCGSGKISGSCCLLYISGAKQPTSPEELMRSRYTAYIYGDSQYLERTWHHSTRPNLSDLTPQPFVKLEVLNSSTQNATVTSDQLEKREGIVEFKAHYINADKIEILHEKSLFLNENGEWKYVNGELYESVSGSAISRSAPCPCGSGKKYKRCHG